MRMMIKVSHFIKAQQSYGTLHPTQWRPNFCNPERKENCPSLPPPTCPLAIHAYRNFPCLFLCNTFYTSIHRSGSRKKAIGLQAYLHGPRRAWPTMVPSHRATTVRRARACRTASTCFVPLAVPRLSQTSGLPTSKSPQSCAQAHPFSFPSLVLPPEPDPSSTPVPRPRHSAPSTRSFPMHQVRVWVRSRRSWRERESR